MTRSGDGRRSSTRIDMRCFVWYWVLSDTGDAREGIAEALDISAGGLGFKTTQAVELGAVVFLELTTRNRNLSALGRVRHCSPTDRGYRLGVEILAVPPNHRTLFAELANDARRRGQ